MHAKVTPLRDDFQRLHAGVGLLGLKHEYSLRLIEVAHFSEYSTVLQVLGPAETEEGRPKSSSLGGSKIESR